MQHANNSENNRQSRGKKRRNEVKFRTVANTTGNHKGLHLLSVTFERYSVDTKMYDTRSKHIEGANGIKT